MNLYLISQNIHNGYDTYSDAVVAAESKRDAVKIHPDGKPVLGKTELAVLRKRSYSDNVTSWGEQDTFPCWANDPSQVQAKLIGRAAPGIERGVICASFHAG